MRFVDTNVLIYAVLASTEDSEKQSIALDLLKNDDLVISVQVLQEFYFQSTHPRRHHSISHEEALGFLASIGHIAAQHMSVQIFHAAAAISHRYQLSYWDGAILAAAQATRCDAVYSEDLSSEQEYGGVRVINPFENV